MSIHDLLARHPVLDGHNDLPWEIREQFAGDLDRIDLDAAVPTTMTDLPRLAAGGVGGQFWSVYVPSNLPPAVAAATTIEQIDLVHRMVAAYPHRLALATTADDVEAALAGGRVASLIGAEGGQSIGESLGVLRMLRELGLRYLTLTHNDNTSWSGSATDAPVPGGLTDFGHEVVRELNRLGVIVDLSHVAVETMHAALDTSTAPVMFSHSSARAVTDVVRNVPDDVLARAAAGGGICMVAFVPEFVNAAVAEWTDEAALAAAQVGIDRRDYPRFKAFCQQRAAAHPKPDATIGDVVAHLEHVRAVAGVDHVGIGADYDGNDSFPIGLGDVSRYPALFAALAERGWSEGDLAKLACRNAIRVLRDVAHVRRD